MHRGFRFRLHPTLAQADMLEQWVGVTRLVYNLALEQRRDWWQQFRAATGHAVSFPSQCRELTDLRKDFEWIAGAPRVPQEQALRDLDKAFDAFFRGGGYPKFRQRDVNDTMRFRGHEVKTEALNAKWGHLRLATVMGYIKFRLTIRLPENIRQITISRSAGAWYATLMCDVRNADHPVANDNAVGIDRGVANTLTLSTGEHISVPSQVGLNRRVARAQKVLSRRRRGSNRYRRQRARVAALRAKGARIRRDALHKASTAIVRRFGVVVIEGLKVRKMTASAAGTIESPGRNVSRKRGLNRSILEQGWSMFADMLAYKLEAVGGQLLTVNPAYTSQTCQACGVIDKLSRKSQAVFECVACGHRDHADINAAKEILRRSTAWQHGEGHPIVPTNRELAMVA